MRVGIKGWARHARGLGSALGELLTAERAVLQRELKVSAAHLKTALILLAVAALLLVAAGVALIGMCYFLLALVLVPWAAALVLAAILGLVAGILLLIMRSQLRQVENPVSTVRRRLREHKAWWRNRVLSFGRPSAASYEGEAPEK